MDELVVGDARGAVVGSRLQTALGIMGIMALVATFWPAAIALGGRILRALPPWISRDDALERGTDGPLRIDSTGIALRHLRIAHEAIDCGWTEGARVVLRLRDKKTAIFDVRDPRVAEAALERLGLGPSERVARMPLASSAVAAGRGVWFHVLSLYLGGSIVVGFLAGAVVALTMGTLAGVLGAVSCLAVATLLAGLYRSVSRAGELTVGADGFRVRSRADKRFVPYADIVSVRRRIDATKKGAVVVTLRSGENLVLQVGTMMDGTPALLQAIEARLLGAMEAWQNRQRAPAGDAAQLDVAAQNVGELQQKLRIAVGEGDYRHARIEPERVASVLEDDGASAKLRFAAAVALLDAQDGKRRIEEVRARVADPELERALDGALSDRLRDDDLARLERRG